jgi:8-oxo-dGTP pyrophosphatase MutT (NUDIX family)
MGQAHAWVWCKVIRDAASVILIRDADTIPKVLMGKRGAGAAFMPDKFVFPGGALDLSDQSVPLVGTLPSLCQDRLGEMAHGLAVAAIRELFEETGLTLGTASLWLDAPIGWEDFASHGVQPDASALRYVFRAVTPPGLPRRFDARFFVVDARALAGDPDALAGSGELSDLAWLDATRLDSYNLPWITREVLASVVKRLPLIDAPSELPYLGVSAKAPE